jgi:hypothetical protein
VPELLLSAFLGLVAGAFATAYKSRKELESLYDIELRRRRIDTYSELWKLLEPLAEWSPPSPVTYGGLAKLSKALRRWYFGSGGLFLSGKTRAPYFNLQAALKGLTKNRPPDDETLLDKDTADIVRELGSRLRTATTDDVATRVGPRLAGRFGARVRWPWALGRPPLRIVVDRRWDFAQEPPEAAFYVIFENTTEHVVKVNTFRVDGGEEVKESFLVQPGEAPERKAPVPRGVQPGEIPSVAVTLADGRTVSSSNTPDVPIKTPVLEKHRRAQ